MIKYLIASIYMKKIYDRLEHLYNHIDGCTNLQSKKRKELFEDFVEEFKYYIIDFNQRNIDLKMLKRFYKRIMFIS